ncbi:FeS-binding protein, partial [bacterium]
GEPWFYRLVKDFDCLVTIRRANIDDEYGFAEIELTGALEEIQRATTWLLTTGLHVEARERALGA